MEKLNQTKEIRRLAKVFDKDHGLSKKGEHPGPWKSFHGDVEESSLGEMVKAVGEREVLRNLSTVVRTSKKYTSKAEAGETRYGFQF
jgi:hypothetical protein